MNGMTPMLMEKHSYEKLPVENKLDILFDYVSNINQSLGQLQKANQRQRIKESAQAVLGGVAGAVMVVTAKLMLWSK